MKRAANTFKNLQINSDFKETSEDNKRLNDKDKAEMEQDYDNDYDENDFDEDDFENDFDEDGFDSDGEFHIDKALNIEDDVVDSNVRVEL